MMTKIDRQSAQALAHIIHELRPTWDPQGIFAALGHAKNMGDLAEVTIAAVRAAIAPDSRTPAVIHQRGPHWAPLPGAAPLARRVEPCPVYGHDGYPATTCAGCRTEWLTTGTWPTGTQHHQAP